MRKILLSGIIILFTITACAPKIPKDALLLKPESLANRQIQTRYYNTNNEANILSACAALLQDLGFNLDESETKLGFILGTKDRSAVEVGQIIGSILLAALTGTAIPTDKKQKMKACVITRPVGEKRIAVRVTFQRIVWNNQGKVSKREGLMDPKHYQEFFDKLSKSIFLEAHEL